MRIGIMLRSWDEAGGVGVYTHNITKELLSKDNQNEYVLFYRSISNLGLFSSHPNVKEIFVRGESKAYWDQIAIPVACQREKVDVIFHPKFTVPLMATCKTVMTVHGADWFMPDQAIYYPKVDVAYIRMLMPIYFHKASAVISVSQLTTDNYNKVLKLPTGKIKTIYFAPARHFKRIATEDVLKKVKDKYSLPDNFILTLTKRQGDKRKNLPQILKAYQEYHANTPDPHQLVIGGKDCFLYREEYGIPDKGYGRDILFPGWIDQTDLPAVYSLARLFLYPSNLEAFPIPITEAMACGTPIITSDANGLKEIAGDAALFVDPRNPQAISAAIQQIINDSDMRICLSEKGLLRSNQFSWDICAQKTLKLLEKVVNN